MTNFESDFFQKFKFTKEQINNYFQGALRDLEIARKDPFAEVRFTYAYQSLIKAGIALLAKVGSVRVRSVPGHHVKIIQKMGEILNDKDIAVIGDAMREKRNHNFYTGAEAITEKEAKDYLEFVEMVVQKVKSKFHS